MMGEQPLFTTKAHVFHIDPSTKKNWIPSSSGSVNVAFYYDTNRSAYRIISVEGSKPIINSTMAANMNFTKTSQKFGQWSDSRANTVYGLGFGSEMELDGFAKKFGEIRELTKQQIPPSIIQNGVPNSIPPDDRVDAKPPPAVVQNSEYMTPMISAGGDNLMQRKQVTNTSSVDNSNQLKYENDRLKLALAQSSQNAKKWEAELQTLKNNNARLTAGLQESNQNVEEWKKQLNAYKEDNARLKKLLIEHEQQNSKQDMSNLQCEVADLMGKLNVTETEKRQHEQELSSLRNRVGFIASLEEQQQKSENQIKDLMTENTELKTKLNSCMSEIDKLRSNQTKDKSDMRVLNDMIARSISQLSLAQQQVSRLMNQ